MSDDFDYVEVSGMVAQYLDKQGRRGKPTGVAMSGAAEAIFGPGEVYSSNAVPLLFQDIVGGRGKARYPFQSDPVDDVQGHDRPVIFHMPVTWSQYDHLVKMAPPSM